MELAFLDPTFDAKRWINESLASKKDDTKEASQFVTTMILKLQLLAQEASSNFEETSQQALLRMPRALLDIERMAQEARVLRQSLSALVQGELSDAQKTTMQSIETMNALHEVKRSLDLCQQTINQVGYLSQSVEKMTSTFEQGSTTQIGQEIAKMQTGLKALEDYPEQHSRFSSQIKGFETRLMQMIEQDCKQALIEHKIKEAQAHLTTLQQIGKLDSVVTEFVKHLIQSVLAYWVAYDKENEMPTRQTPPPQPEQEGEDGPPSSPTTEQPPPPPLIIIPFPTWLPGFFTEVKTLLNKERNYYLNIFGQDKYCDQLVNMIATLWHSLQPSFESRVSVLALPEAVAAYTCTKTFFNHCTTEIVQAAPEASRQQLWILLESVIYNPYLDCQLGYAEKEKKLLLERIKTLKWVDRVQKVEQHQQEQDNVPTSTDNTAIATPTTTTTVIAATSNSSVTLSTGLVSQIADGSANLFVWVEEALNRCFEFTEGVQCQGLVKTLTEVLTEYCKQIQQVLAQHTLNAQLADTGDDRGTTLESVKVGLHFYQVCGSIVSKLRLFEKIVYKEILQCTSLQHIGVVQGRSSSTSSTQQQNVVQNKPRLLRECPDKLPPLAQFLRSIEQLKYPMFSDAANSFQLLCKDAEEWLFKIMMIPIHTTLKTIPDMDVWTESDDKFSGISGIAGADAVSMGSLSPTESIRSVGDYLFELPVTLDPAESREEDDEDAAELVVGESSVVAVSYWIEIVCNRSCDLFLTEIGKIPHLSNYGNAQLAADVEYLLNLLTSFQVDVKCNLLEEFYKRQQQKVQQISK